MRNIVEYYLISKGIPIRTDGDSKGNLPLPEAIKLIKSLNIAVEFHCNTAASKSVKGVEALSQPKDNLIGQKPCVVLSSVMGFP